MGPIGVLTALVVGRCTGGTVGVRPGDEVGPEHVQGLLVVASLQLGHAVSTYLPKLLDVVLFLLVLYLDILEPLFQEVDPETEFLIL